MQAAKHPVGSFKQSWCCCTSWKGKCCLQDGYAVDEWGIHHRVLNAVVETKPGTACHGIMDVYTDRLELRGAGAMVSATMHARLQKSMDYNQCQQQNKDAASDGLQITGQTS